MAVIDDMEHWWLLFLLRLAGVQVIPDLHCTFWPRDHRPGGIRHRIVQTLNGWFWRYIPIATICVSPECERQVRALAGPRVQGEIIQARSHYMRGYLDSIPLADWEARPFRLLFAGRIEADKGIFDLLSVAERIHEQVPGSLIVEMCGTGSAEQRLVAAIEERGLIGVVDFKGRLDRQGMREAYSRAHAVVVPTLSSFAEGLNRVVVEGVLSGRPVVATEVCNTQDVLERSVIHVRASDIDAMADAVLRLATDRAFYETKCAGCRMDEEPFYDSARSWGAALRKAVGLGLGYCAGSREEQKHKTCLSDLNAILLTTILVNYNTASLLPAAVEALRKAANGLSHKLVIVDNASRDDSAAVMKHAFGDCQLLFNGSNVGFGRANNQALPFLAGRYALLLNTDAFVAPDTLEKTLSYMDKHPRVGIVGVKLVGRDGKLQPSCRYFPTPWNLFLHRTGLSQWFPGVRLVDDLAWDHATPRACDWVPGCYYLVRREVIDKVGLFDPRYFLYYEEVDHCLAVKRAGWEVHFFPDTTVVHIGGESAKSEGEISGSGRQLEALQLESELLYFRKNHGLGAAVLDALLHTLTDVIVPLKQALKGCPACWAVHQAHASLVWSLFRRTRWASQPAR